MAVVLQSKTTPTFSAYTSGNITVTKPSGLIVGDLMVLQVSLIAVGSASTTTFTKTDWKGFDDTSTFTIKKSTIPGGAVIIGAYKIADSADVAAIDFTFTGSGSSESGSGLAASLLRIDGHEASAPISAFNTGSVDNSESPSFATGITPSESALHLMMNTSRYTVGGGSITALSGYAITTSNPSWTEEYEALSAASGMSLASATRPQTTSTGAWSYSVAVSSTGSATYNASILVAIKANVNVTINDAVQSVVSSVQEPTVSGNAGITADVQSVASSVQAPTVSTPTPTWSNQSKSSPTWTNLNKS